MRASRIPITWLVVLATACTGCFPVPFVVPVPPLGYTQQGKPISQDLVAFIRPRVTTKADVVWELGTPDASGRDSSDGRAVSEEWVSYTSWRHRGGVVGGVVVFVATAPAGGLGAAHLCRRPWTLKIWFDKAGVVERHAFTPGETQCKNEELHLR